MVFIRLPVALKAQFLHVMIEKIVAFHQASFLIEVAGDQKARNAWLQLIRPFPFWVVILLFVIELAFGTAVVYFPTHPL